MSGGGRGRGGRAEVTLYSVFPPWPLATFILFPPHSVPMSTFILGPNNDELAELYFSGVTADGGELCPNVTYLGEAWIGLLSFKL